MCGAYGASSAVQFAGATSDSGKYLYGSNQWGWDDSGAQCMTVSPSMIWSCDTRDSRLTIVVRQVGLDDSDDAASFNVTWSWTERDVWVCDTLHCLCLHAPY
jgi:xyloglucan-specific endo-beta-1,4-glucanase